MDSTRRQARWAGFLYLLVALIAPIGLIFVPNRLFYGNAAETAAAIRASEWLLRMGIASELVNQIIEVFLVLALYRLLSPVHKAYAKQMLILGLLPIPIVFVNVVNELAALVLLTGTNFLSAFPTSQLEALAYLFVRLHGQGVAVASVFWGLWLLPFGMLVIRSNFIPRILGILLWVAGAAYLLDSFVKLVLTQYAAIVSDVALPLQACELTIILWLLIVGTRPSPARIDNRAHQPVTGYGPDS
jgi:uncharacterized protein DUF4386